MSAHEASMNTVTPDLLPGAPLFGSGSVLQAPEDLIFGFRSHKSIFPEACTVAANEFSLLGVAV